MGFKIETNGSNGQFAMSNKNKTGSTFEANNMLFVSG